MKDFEITQEQLDALMNAGKPVVMIKVGEYWPASQQENANNLQKNANKL